MNIRLLAISLSLLMNISLQAAEESSWTIENRVIPPPAGASELLRNSIAGTPQPDLEASSQFPQSVSEWKSLISSANNPVPLDLIAQTLSVTIEKSSIAGVTVYRVEPLEIAPEHEDHLFIYAHGGAYVFNGGDAAISESALVASMMGMRAVAIDYRMPPDNPFPAAVYDFVSVYNGMLESFDAEDIAVGGSSAGAGLAMAGLHKLKQLGVPMPAVLYAGSPWADLTKTGDTMFTNEGIDRILVTYDGYLGAAARLYANGNELRNPLISPVYGSFSGFPPTILVTGTRDLFLSDTVRVHRKLRAEGIDAELHVYEAMSHTGYGFMRQAPESQDFYGELAAFINKHFEQH